MAVLSANAGELLSNNVADNSESQLVSIESGEHRLSWSLSAASMLNTQQAGQLQQQGCVLETTLIDSPVLYQSEQFIGALPAKQLYQHSLSSLSEAEIKNNINSQQEETNYQKTIATKAVSSVLYQNAFGDKVDLQYTVAPSKIKEDVILRENSAFHSYTMNVDTNGLTAVKSENNTVEFLKTDGTSVFIIQTPYMYDSADECSYDIDIIIEQTGNIASVTYTPDSNWINSGERVYPITIDPSVQAVSSLNRSSISDTYVHEGNGSCCSGINPSTHVLKALFQHLLFNADGLRVKAAVHKIRMEGRTQRDFGILGGQCLALQRKGILDAGHADAEVVVAAHGAGVHGQVCAVELCQLFGQPGHIRAVRIAALHHQRQKRMGSGRFTLGRESKMDADAAAVEF